MKSYSVAVVLGVMVFGGCGREEKKTTEQEEVSAGSGALGSSSPDSGTYVASVDGGASAPTAPTSASPAQSSTAAPQDAGTPAPKPKQQAIAPAVATPDAGTVADADAGTTPTRYCVEPTDPCPPPVQPGQCPGVDDLNEARFACIESLAYSPKEELPDGRSPKLRPYLWCDCLMVFRGQTVTCQSLYWVDYNLSASTPEEIAACEGTL